MPRARGFATREPRARADAVRGAGGAPDRGGGSAQAACERSIPSIGRGKPQQGVSIVWNSKQVQLGAVWGAAFALASVFALTACDDNDACDDGGADCPDASQSMDGGMDAAKPPMSEDGGQENAGSDAGTDAGPLPVACLSCDDGAFCNGIERCMAADDDDDAGDGWCLPALAPPCSAVACDEEHDRCDCDLDGDGVRDGHCGGDDEDDDGDGEARGTDCDDRDPRRRHGYVEVCDLEGLDEDCDLDTAYGPEGADLSPDRDRDHDKHPNALCINKDEAGNVTSRGDDCDDRNPEVHPGGDIQEVCDGIDNDCDGVVDMVRRIGDAGDEYVDLMKHYCFDEDGDGYASGDLSKSVMSCGQLASFVLCQADEALEDCDDDPAAGGRTVYPGRIEECDGLDNNCDGEIDNRPKGGLLPGEMISARPTVECIEGGLQITACVSGTEWCDKTTIANGCETDTTRLTRCGGCDTTDCHFACGQNGCDELSDIAMGADFACGVTHAGRVACWGRGTQGRLGDDLNRSATIPVPVFGLHDGKAVSVGVDHACAIVGEARSLYCWGSNTSRRLGNRDADAFSTVPIPVIDRGSTTALTGIVQVAAGVRHSCAVGSDGQVRCWGATDGGRLGQYLSDPGDSLPVTVLGPLVGMEPFAFASPIADVAQVVVGDDHSCARTHTGEVHCWGSNGAGQLGEDPTGLNGRDHAEPVPGLPAIAELAAGGFHTCARTTTGRVFCWGDNTYHQLGRDDGATAYVPTEVAGLPDVAGLTAGVATTCAWTADGEGYCWGSNEHRVFGAETPSQSTQPVLLPVTGVARIALKLAICVVNDADIVQCWGNNEFGQLGRGTTSLEPLSVPDFLTPLTGSRR